MITKLTARIIKEVSPKILTKILLNLVIKNVINLRGFQRRMAQESAFFPGFMIISLTNRCNLNCQGCWVSNEEPHDLPFEVLKNVVSSCIKKGSSYFGLVGGEPLLYPHLFELFETFPNVYFQLFTNGTLLTDAVAKRLRKLGNVTPLISVEGLEEESDRRRNGKDVFASALTAIKNCTRNKLFIGVATSVCKTNHKDLVSDDFLKELIKLGVHYMWYYIYRPVGSRPHPELALDKDEILSLRKFMVDARLKHPIAIIDAYWDADGKALCPGAKGLSHHLSPEGHVEFCPPLQFAFKQVTESNDFAQICQDDAAMAKLRKLISCETDGCIILSNPELLSQKLKELNAIDTSGRNSAFAELDAMAIKPCHDLPGQEIPEKSILYRLAKKYSFFGFSSYG